MHIIFNIPVEAVEISPADGNVYVAPFCMGASCPGSEKDNPLNVVFCGKSRNITEHSGRKMDGHDGLLSLDAPAALRVQRVQKGRFLGLTGPMGRRVLKLDGPSDRGLRIALSGDEFYNAAFRRSRPHQVS